MHHVHLSPADVGLIMYLPDGTCKNQSLQHFTIFTIGRELANNLILPDPTISRCQLEFVRQGNTSYFYVICRSLTVKTMLRNYTLMVNQPFAEPLRDKDELRFGRYKIIFYDQNITLPASNLSRNLTQPRRTASLSHPVPATQSTQIQANSKNWSLKQGRLYYNQGWCKLTPKEFQFLTCLFNKSGLCTYQELEDILYPIQMNSSLEEVKLVGQRLNRLVSDLRRKLIQEFGEDSKKLIQTEYGFGYSLNLN